MSTVSAEGLPVSAESTENLVMPDDAPAMTSSDDLHQLEQAAERAANVVRLAANRRFRKRWARRLRRGLPKNRRDCLDMAGKLPLSMWARSAGLDSEHLVVDFAQAGGICGTSDGRIRLPDGSHEDIEIKGSRAKSGKPNSFAFKAIRCAGTNWKHLFLVGRRREPQKWSDWADVGGAIMLGHVTRSRYEAALDKAGLSRSAPKDATVTPGSARSWLGGAVNWVRLEEADLAWWRQNVLNVSDSGPARASPVAC